ncbi:PorP/SprF family type IX secretion system membrane protein [Winogradskyella schleiferi]|uniref:PorP/SprF family type IX secretion system membrane protein n=1 Tax=Winogradskyella schleiferi TaxID=2686078 RepID=UPI0015C116E7|nr:PorP/SprF family type IX secretion system membrane protein [Winogradskyella schleiferi]
MKKYLLILIICTCSIQTFYSQEDDGVVSLAIPTRNSLTFNRYTINPTFSFVREQTKFISIYNKREWVQFDNAPLTYLASYSGRFGENLGAGLGLFQQNYGVLTTFGGILNFAYNAKLGQDSNLTFGINIGAYKSGVNTGNVVTNFDDPSLQNVPENFLMTINPGINYGTEFLDFGLSFNNLVLYNFETSAMIEDNPQQSIQAHVMYTGYMSSRGFFDESKFTALVRSDFQKDETIISGVAMVTVPKGIWAQAGYNTLYGASGGVGINITKQIAIEYNYERTFGNLNNFGSSHEITLAYRFKNDNYYDYSREDEVSSIISGGNKRRRISKSSKSRTASRKSTNDTKLGTNVSKAKSEADEQAKLVAEQKAKAKAHEQAEVIAAQQRAQQEAEAKAKIIEEQKAKELAEVQAELDQIEAEKKAEARAATRARLEAEKAKAEADAQAKLLAEQKAKAKADAQAKLMAEQKAKAEAEAQAKLLAEQKAKAEADAQAKLIAEQKAKAEADAQAKLLAEQKAKAKADAQAKLLAEQKAKAEADAQAELLAEQKAKEEADAQAQLIAEQKAKAEADAQAKLLAEQRAKEDAISNPTDELAKSMQGITKITEASKVIQNELFEQFNDIVDIKDQDLKDLKEENDLSDQGITVQPKPFKSVTAENNKLNAIKSDLENVIKTRSEKIDELNKLYEERTEVGEYALDEVNLFYKKEIKRLKSEQLKAIELKAQLDKKLEAIKVATEFEKRRRIKRAAFNNEEDRYSQDRAMLKNIKQTTKLSDKPLKAEDFDFGEVLGNNIKILKNIDNVESGYYLIIAVHSDTTKRNEFVTNVVASGRSNVDFFHDVNTSKYYIFYDKFENIGNANEALKTKGDRPYNGKMSIVKIEN